MARKLAFIAVTVVSLGTDVSAAERVPALVATDEAIDLNARDRQATSLLNDRRVPSNIRELFKKQAQQGASAATNIGLLKPNKDLRETVTDNHKVDNPRQLVNSLLSGLIDQQGNAAASVSGVVYVLKREIRGPYGNGYRVEPLWDWVISISGKPSNDIEDQKLSRPQSLVSVRSTGAAAGADSTDDVVVVGTYRENENATSSYGRLAFVGPKRQWGFDQIYGHKDTKRSEFTDAMYLDDTNEVLVLGNADNNIWLLKFDVASKWVLWDRVYDLTKFRVTPLPQGVVLTPSTKLTGIRLARMVTGDFVIVGTVTRGNDTDLLIMSLTPQGKIRWARACGGSGIDEGKAVYAMQDGSIIVGGRTGSKRDSSVGWLLKVDVDGYIIWEKGIGNVSIEAISYQKPDWFLVVDFWWNVLSVSTGKQNPFEKYNWAGSRSWTKAGPSSSPFAEDALTCLDLLWVPGLDEAMNGKPQLEKMIRDRRRE